MATPLKQVVRRRCPQCGVELRDDATSCWLCLKKFVPDSELPLASEPVAAKEPVGGFSLSSLLMFVTLVCVILGVMTIARGLGIVLAFVAFVAWLRTVVAVQKRASAHKEVTSTDKVLLFFRSVATTIAIIGLVLVACVATLFIACWAMIGASGFH
jgi:hypothetical protein